LLKNISVKITPASEETGVIRAQLKKFFHRRPTRESLVKKGIFKGMSALVFDATDANENSQDDTVDLEGTLLL